MTIDLSQFYSGGYFLIRANDPNWGDEWRSDLLPTKLISLSQCIGRQFRVNWGWLPGDRQAALDFGIPERLIDECLHWCEYEYDTYMDMWSVFLSPDAARRCIQRFELMAEDLHLIGVGLPKQADIPAYFQSACSPEGHYGIEKQIALRRSLEIDGQPLGFEIVSYDGYGDFSHSWLCSGLHKDMLDQFGIRSNVYGLVDTPEEAIKIYEWIKADEQKGGRAEPEPYFPLLLLEYSLS